jgi:hypothetical protein
MLFAGLPVFLYHLWPHLPPHDVIERGVVAAVSDTRGQQANALLDVGDGGQTTRLLEASESHLHTTFNTTENTQYEKSA